MAGDGVNVPLLLRTVQTLRERFAALRSAGPIPAVMEEAPRGGGTEKRDPMGLPPFGDWKKSMLRWCGGGVVDRAGRSDLLRHVWLFHKSDESVSQLLLLCRDANGFVPFVRRHYGLPSDCGTTDPVYRWIWTVFELAEARPPFTVLALGGASREVFRTTGPRGLTTPDRLVEAVKDDGIDTLPARFIRSFRFPSERYWQLDDFAEASVAVMDLIEVATPSLADEHDDGPNAGEEGAAGKGGDEEPEDTTKGQRGRKRRTADGLPLNATMVARAVEDPSRKRWVAAQWAEIIPWKKRAIEGCATYKLFRREAAAERRAEAEQAETELASRNSEDEGDHGFRVSSTKSGVGRQKTTARERRLDRAGTRLIARAERAKKRPK